MDKELNALRRVAKAAKKYQEKVIQRRGARAKSESEHKDNSNKVADMSSAEFELSQALNDWYRTQHKSE